MAGRQNGKSNEEIIKSWIRLCCDPRTAPDLLENAAYWESINTAEKYEIRMAIARNRSTPADLLSKLSMCNSLQLQIAVAAHQNLSEVTAGKLLRSHLRELRRSLSGNPKIPIFVMHKLSKDYKDVRMSLAKNPNLPKEIMLRLARQKEKAVRKSLVQNRNVHTEALGILSRDTDEEVRTMVAENPKVPLAGLRNMATDSSTNVREAVLERGLDDFPTDRPLFKALAKHKNSDSAKRAQEHLEYMDIKAQAAKKAVSMGLEPPD